MNRQDSYFYEEQQFRQKWLIILIAGLFLIFLYSIIQQVIIGIPFGNNPAPPLVLFLMGLIPLFMIFFIFFVLKLKTNITPEEIEIQFVPFQRNPKKYNWQDIEEAYVREYKPILEYGGWGLRTGFFSKSIAYNVSGKTGLQLVLKNGRKVLIGTQKADELRYSLEKIRKKQQTAGIRY
ncbi:MAG: hypothetical protein NTW49_04140 [Bacteroidia bacterium]|nr:hypothetical protein [Bacteroidia bacterium]